MKSLSGYVTNVQTFAYLLLARQLKPTVPEGGQKTVTMIWMYLMIW